MDRSETYAPEESSHDGELVADHGAAKQAEPTDPMDLVGTVVPGGDVLYLARCFIEEFAAMGYGGEKILDLFRDPQYVAVHPVFRSLGEDGVRELVEQVLRECGVFRVTETVSTESEPRPSELIQIEKPCAPSEDDQV